MALLLVLTLVPSFAGDSPPGARLVPQVGHGDYVHQVAFDDDGTLLVSASQDGTAAIWDVDSGAMLWRLAGHGGPVLAARFVDDGDAVQTVSAVGEIVTFDARSGEEVRRAIVDAQWSSAVFVSDRVLAVDGERQARFWTTTGVGQASLSAPVSWVSHEGVSANGRMIAAPLADDDNAVGIFKGRSGALKQTVGAGGERVRGVALSPKGRTVLVADGSKEVRAYSARSGTPETPLVPGEDARQFYVRFGTDGTVYSADRRGVVRTFSADRSEQHAQLMPTGVQGSLVLHPDGDRLAASAGSAAILVWGANDGTVQALRGQVRMATALGNVNSGLLPIGHTDGTASVWSPYSGRLRGVYEIGRDPVATIDLHNRGLLLGTTERDVGLYNVRSGNPRPLFKLERQTPGAGAALSMDGRELYVADPFGAEGYRIDPFRGAFMRKMVKGGFLTTEARSIGAVDRFKARRTGFPRPDWLRLGDDGAIHIVDPETQQVRGSMYVFGDGNWAVIDPEGRFDAGDDSSLDGLFWIIDGQPYRLAQMRDRYFEPGLLAKLVGYSDEPLRDVPSLASVETPPAVHAEGPSPDGTYTLRLENRGNGIGALWATLNGSDIAPEIEARCPGLRNGDACTLQLSDLPTWLPGDDNRVHVEAASGNGMLRSRGIDSMVTAKGAPIGDPPDLWVLAVGTGDYAGDDLDLTYAAADAIRLGEAIEIAGAKGFGADRTHVRVLSTVEREGVYATPSRAALKDAFSWLAQADPLDTVLVFFSGHGAAHTDAESDDYFYLLPDAGSFADVRDPQLRGIRTWSGEELARSMARIPALKRLVVLDTCAAGKIEADLSAHRSLSSDAIRAHARSRERTGAWLLAGAAADKVSYEASRYGQGVLTYALLEGMRGPALDDGNLLMVSRWLGWAEQQVPAYAAGIGGVQRPITRRGSADDFPLGQLPPETRDAIPVNRVRPVVVSASVVGRGGRQDTVGCTAAINTALRDGSHHADASFAYWDSDPALQTWQITGTCTESNGKVRLDGYLTRTGEEGPEQEHTLRVQGTSAARLGTAAVQAATPLLAQ